MSQLVIRSPASVFPALVAAAGERAGMRFLEFLAAKNRAALCYCLGPHAPLGLTENPAHQGRIGALGATRKVTVEPQSGRIIRN